jgi:hypothetical protein
MPDWFLVETWRRQKAIDAKLDLILTRLDKFQQEGAHMTQELDDLTSAVHENASLDDSIIQLVNGLAAQIMALKDDPAAMVALASELRAKSTAITDAIRANTPA